MEHRFCCTRPPSVAEMANSCLGLYKDVHSERTRTSVVLSRSDVFCIAKNSPVKNVHGCTSSEPPWMAVVPCSSEFAERKLMSWLVQGCTLRTDKDVRGVKQKRCFLHSKKLASQKCTWMYIFDVRNGIGAVSFLLPE